MDTSHSSKLHLSKVSPPVFPSNTEIELLLIETDACVLCGKDTGIPSYTPIGLRPHYIEASGQLCPKCYLELYSDGNAH